MGGVTLAAAFSEPTQGSIEVPPRITTSFDPVSKRVARSPITIDPETGENRFTQESIIDRIVADEGENTGLGRQLTEAFEEEVDINAVKEGGIVSLSTGGGPGGRASTGHYGEVGPIGVNTYNPYTAHYTSTPDRRGEGGYQTPVASPFEFPEVSPFRSNSATFNIQDRLQQIRGELPPIISVPNVSNFETDNVLPITSEDSTSALEDLLNRVRAKKDDSIVSLVAPVIEESNKGGLVSLANGGEPTAQNIPVFEGQVPMNGDGMDDDVPFKVLPQTSEDVSETPDIALLSSDEYVLPADVVSMLGNGSSNAGAATLDRFTKLVRRKAHGTNKQQTELDEDKELSNLL